MVRRVKLLAIVSLNYQPIDNFHSVDSKSLYMLKSGPSGRQRKFSTWHSANSIAVGIVSQPIEEKAAHSSLDTPYTGYHIPESF